MDTLQRALVEKAGNDNGFEYILPTDSAAVELGSARHRARVLIAQNVGDGFTVRLTAGSALIAGELIRSFPAVAYSGGAFQPGGIGALAKLLRRAAALSQALPNQALTDFSAEVDKAFAALPADAIKHTEVQVMVRQRVGQDLFRKALLEYWGGACAVTGVSLPAVLRASHAKPWAECSSDAERLDVFNGLLLCAHLDALFDRYLISVGEGGELLIADTISEADRNRLGLVASMRVRWIADEHQAYLHLHRLRYTNTILSGAISR